jgi:hypothetical protein
MQLVEDLGFDAVDAGSLAESWPQQPGTPSYVQDFEAPRLKPHWLQPTGVDSRSVAVPQTTCTSRTGPR